MHLAPAALALALAFVLPSLPAQADAAPPLDRGRLHKRKKVAPKISLIDDRAVFAKRKKAAPAKAAVLHKGAFDWQRHEAEGRDARAWRLLEQKARVRRAMILQLEKLAASRNLPPPKKAEVLFRLAEVWREESHYRYLLDRQEYERRMRAYEASTTKTR